MANKVVIKLDVANSSVLQAATRNGWTISGRESSLKLGVISMHRKNEFGLTEFGCIDLKSKPATFTVTRVYEYEISINFSELELNEVFK